jgi:dTDP-4-dehydrorhamnose reductase
MSLFERIVVVGATGQLGSDLMAELAEFTPIAANRSAYDLGDHDAMRALVARYRPTLLINTAAYHNVEHCEIHPDRAMAINALAVDALAQACAIAGTVLAHVSTDYVFDGRTDRPYREDDAVNPISAYGISKAAGEQLVRRHGARHFIVRTSGLYGRAGSSTKGYTFVERVLSQAERGEKIRIVDDMTFSPSYTRDVALTIRSILERGTFGTYHVANDGYCTWFDFAAEAFRLAGLRDADVTAVSYRSFDQYIGRPAYSALSLNALKREGIALPRHWQDGLAAYLSARPKPAIVAR